mmetsp:Transcript_115266/g.306478  ORF Transcript_115266/g.306478 Transcript_115266/m.306478 type:complete len:338 (+) Transcript_115266:36-1049(+)
MRRYACVGNEPRRDSRTRQSARSPAHLQRVAHAGVQPGRRRAVTAAARAGRGAAAALDLVRLASPSWRRCRRRQSGLGRPRGAQIARGAPQHLRVDGEVVGPRQALVRRALPRVPALDPPEAALAEDMVDGPAVHERAVRRLRQVADGKHLPAAEPALQQVPDDPVAGAAVQVPHPDDLSTGVPALHGVEVVVQLPELALVHGVAAARAVAEVNAPRDKYALRGLLPQYRPVRSTVAAPRAAAVHRLHAPLEAVEPVAVVEDVGPVAPEAAPAGLHFVGPPLDLLVQMRPQARLGGLELVEAYDVRVGPLDDRRDAPRVPILVIDVPLQELQLDFRR